METVKYAACRQITQSSWTYQRLYNGERCDSFGNGVKDYKIFDSEAEARAQLREWLEFDADKECNYSVSTASDWIAQIEGNVFDEPGDYSWALESLRAYEPDALVYLDGTYEGGEVYEYRGNDDYSYYVSEVVPIYGTSEMSRAYRSRQELAIAIGKDDNHWGVNWKLWRGYADPDNVTYYSSSCPDCEKEYCDGFDTEGLTNFSIYDLLLDTI